MARGGVHRRRLEDEISYRFSLQEIAPAQAALAVEVRRDRQAAELLSGIDDGHVRKTVNAERSLLAYTGAGCGSALGALGEAARSLQFALGL